MLVLCSIGLWKITTSLRKTLFLCLIFPLFVCSFSSLQFSAFPQCTNLQDNIFVSLWARLLCHNYLLWFSFPIADRLLLPSPPTFKFPPVLYLAMEEEIHTLDTTWVSFSELGWIPFDGFMISVHWSCITKWR